ncbi:MAG: DUF4383 domain-containing protein [Candidatus Dormibacteria bacterium]
MRIRGKTMAQVYSLVFGATLVLSGLAGFLVNSSFAYGDHIEGRTLVLFEVNGWHNALHLIVGALGLMAFFRPGAARVFAIGWGGTAAVLAVWGTLSSYPAFGLIPGGVGGVILHLSDASLGIFAWLVSAPSRLSVSSANK